MATSYLFEGGKMFVKKKILRFFILVTGAFFWTWFIIPVFTGGIGNLGNFLGCFAFGALALYGIFFERINALVKKICRRKKLKAALLALGIFAAVGLFAAVGASVYMVQSASQPPENDVTLVVLGCQVNGEAPSLMLSQRAKKAYEYLSTHPQSKCVLSGGKGRGESISEAECLYRILTARGIEPHRLYKEDKSTDTRENISFSAQLMRQEGLNPEIAIVTNEFHVCRARIIAKKLGISTYALPAATSLWLLPTFWVRDMCGVLYELSGI